jgi:hypothetical protein
MKAGHHQELLQFGAGGTSLVNTTLLARLFLEPNCSSGDKWRKVKNLGKFLSRKFAGFRGTCPRIKAASGHRHGRRTAWPRVLLAAMPLASTSV